jgi:hypothetical protein
MLFEILGEISQIETFASGSGIREIAVLWPKHHKRFDDTRAKLAGCDSE